MKQPDWQAVAFTVGFVILITSLAFSAMWFNCDDSTEVTIYYTRLIKVMQW